MSFDRDPVELPSADELKALTAAALSYQGPIGVPFLIDVPASLAIRLAVVPVEAVVIGDGRTAMLLKTAIGWKENFRAWLFTTAPLLGSEIRQDPAGRRIISLPAPPPWEELYVRGRRTEQIWEVFFDLN